MAGNVVVTKHASNVPRCAGAFDLILKESGGPEGVHTNLQLSARHAAFINSTINGSVEAGANDPRARHASRGSHRPTHP